MAILDKSQQAHMPLPPQNPYAEAVVAHRHQPQLLCRLLTVGHGGFSELIWKPASDHHADASLVKGVSSDLQVPSRPSLLQPSTLEPSATTVLNPSPIRVVLLPWLNPNWHWYTHQGEATWKQKSRSMQMNMLQVEREVSLAGWCQDDLTAGTRVSIRTGPRTPTTEAKGVVSNAIREFGFCPEGSGNQWNLPSYGLSRGLEGNQNRKQRPSKGCSFVHCMFIEHELRAKHSPKWWWPESISCWC